MIVDYETCQILNSLLVKRNVIEKAISFIEKAISFIGKCDRARKLRAELRCSPFDTSSLMRLL